MTKNHPSDDSYTNVLLEDVNSKFDAVMEALVPMKELQSDVGSMKEDLQEVKADIKTIKAAVVDLSKQVNDHEHRIGTLEAAT